MGKRFFYAAADFVWRNRRGGTLRPVPDARSVVSPDGVSIYSGTRLVAYHAQAAQVGYVSR